MGQERYRNGFKLTLQPDVVQVPLRWKRPRMIFVNSMSDLFHKDVPADFIAECFAVMQRASQHTFQVLTKAPTAPPNWPLNFRGQATSGWARRLRMPNTSTAFASKPDSSVGSVSLPRTASRPNAATTAEGDPLGHCRR